MSPRSSGAAEGPATASSVMRDAAATTTRLGRTTLLYGSVKTPAKRLIWRTIELPDACLDAVDDLVWRRGSGGHSNDFCPREPFRPDILVRLHVMHVGAVPRTCLHQFARVVARSATDDDDDVGLPCHFDGR